MLTLALALATQAQPLSLEVAFDKPSYKQGEVIEASLMLKNTSDKPQIIALSQWDGGLTAGTTLRLLRNGKPVQLKEIDSSHPLRQVMAYNKVNEARFATLRPGEFKRVHWMKFKEEMEYDGIPEARTKRELANAKVILTPLHGTYTVSGSYSFDRRTDTGFRGPYKEYKFTPGAKAMFDRSFAGELKASAALRIE